MNNYKTSKDYSHLKQLLDAGQEIVCFTTYDWDHIHEDDPNHVPIIACDVCCACYNSGRYVFAVRGHEYDAYYPERRRYSSFEQMCQENNIEFLDPGKPIQPNLVVELKQYLATTPPEQQQRDWEQIKAELPDAGQVPVIFYGLSGSTSHATPTDNEPQSNQSDLDYLKSEIEKMHSFFLSESAEFPQCGAYQKAEAIADVLALFDTLPQKQLTHSVTKKPDQVIKNDNLEKELQSLLKESGVTIDYVHQDFLRVVARHFAAYGKDQFLKAMKENHVDTI